jgi:hypothetical protein
VVNSLRKLYFLGAYFVIGYPVALVARSLFGQDSDNMYAWPEKYWFSGTMMVFFFMVQPLAFAAMAEINAG